MTGLAHERSPMQVELDAVILARVKAGIALLKEQYGDDFADHIDLGRLNLKVGNNCVLGQLYDGYDKGEMKLFPGAFPGEDNFIRAAEYGFWAHEADSDLADDLDVNVWDVLDDVWHRELSPK